MEKVFNWFRNNWFLWLALLLFYVTLRLFGLDVLIYDKSKYEIYDKYNFELKKIDRRAGPPLDAVLIDSTVNKGPKRPRF